MDTLRRATEIIRHRGPDDEGFVFFDGGEEGPVILSGAGTPRVADGSGPEWFPKDSIDGKGDETARLGLGHRRLSILDLSPLGHQPMSYDGGRYWITYNGEIFNYLEIRAELEALGRQFVSQSDTEVILAAYAQWGQDFLHRLNGMWSFAIYDRKENSLFMARDRFGVKPLYYWVGPGGDFYFGSEIKQFTALPGWAAVLNDQRAYDFLVWGITDHTDETLFRGVYHVPPGHFALMSVDGVAHHNGRIPVQKWYEIPENKFSGNFEEASLVFKDALSQSVRLRLRSDVAVGSCLSGGLDSSSIVCLVNGVLRESGMTEVQKTFSALSSFEKINEQKWIEHVVSDTGVDAYYTKPEIDRLFDLAEKITWHQDEPFGSTSIFAQWNVFALAAENDVRVMLDGQGADEQLFGYHGAMGVRLGSLFRDLRFIQLAREIYLLNKILGYSYGHILTQLSSSIIPDKMQPFFRKILKKTVHEPEWLNIRADKKNPFLSSLNSVKDYCRSQLISTNLQMLLHWEDRDSMAHSIESRVPFLDYRVVEFSMSLPDDFKIKNAITKRVLRNGMSGIIPDVIRDRTDKIGFATPEEAWIREVAPDLFRKKMQESIDLSCGVLNSDAMTVLEEIIDGRRPFSFVVWRMINFGQWMKIFSVQLGDRHSEAK